MTATVQPSEPVRDRNPRGAPEAERTGVMRWLPGLHTLRVCDSSSLRHDIVAGLVMTTMLVPVGIAYAEASGLPGINGLYATIVPLLAYALFGPSRILILGPDSALAAVILAVVLPLSAGEPERAVSPGGLMAIVSGTVCVAAGLSRLGFLTELLSKPIRYGYMNGIALTVVLSQIPKLFGFSVPAGGPVRQSLAIVERVWAGSANLVAVAIGGGALALILVLKRWPRVPGMLIAVTAATMVVAMFDLAARAGISVLGPLPLGLPAPRLPLVPSDSLVPIIMGGAAVALVSFADTSVLSRTYAARLRTPVDPNHEMIALGAANLAAGFFQGFPVSSSSSRTPVAEAAGARTQLTGVVGAFGIALLLMLAPALLRNLPNTALAAVVIASAIGLFEVSDLRRIYRIQRWEFWLSMTCFAGVAIFGAIPGIALAIVIAVIEFLWDGWRPHSAVLGSVDGVNGYHDITRYPGAHVIPGLVLFRWDAPLFFANAELFRDRVLAAAAHSPTPVRSIIVAAEPVTSIDVTAADILRELDEALGAAGIDLCFAEMKDPVKDKLKRFGLSTRFGEKNLFATIDEAVDSYRARSLGDAGPTPDRSDRRPSDDAEANVQAVRDLYAAFARHDVAAILAVLSPDVEWSEPDSPFNPCGGTRHGHAGFLEWARLGHESEEVLSLEPQVFLTGSNRVAIVGHTRCRAKSTGRTYETDFVHLVTFDQGRVVRFQEFFDTHAAAEAFRTQ